MVCFVNMSHDKGNLTVHCERDEKGFIVFSHESEISIRLKSIMRNHEPFRKPSEVDVTSYIKDLTTGQR